MDTSQLIRTRTILVGDNRAEFIRAFRPRRKETNDCVVHALSNAIGLDYISTNACLIALKLRSIGEGTYIKPYLKSTNGQFLHRKFCKLEHFSGGKMNMSAFIHLVPTFSPSTVLLVIVPRHMLCMKANMLYDTHYACPSDVIDEVWELEPASTPSIAS